MMRPFLHQSSWMAYDFDILVLHQSILRMVRIVIKTCNFNFFVKQNKNFHSLFCLSSKNLIKLVFPILFLIFVVPWSFQQKFRRQPPISDEYFPLSSFKFMVDCFEIVFSINEELDLITISNRCKGIIRPWFIWTPNWHVSCLLKCFNPKFPCELVICFQKESSRVVLYSDAFFISRVLSSILYLEWSIN